MDFKPVVALDIDGTLGDFHGHFTRFAEQWSGRSMPDPRTMGPGMPFYRFLGMSKATYRQCKLAYRQGGMLRSMPMYEHVPEMTQQFRKNGADIWICTTRPYKLLDNIDPDTRHWLRRNKVQFDYLISGPNKYKDLARRVPAHSVVAVLDDLPEMLEQADSCGLPAYVRDQPYNRCIVPAIARVYDFWNDNWVDKITAEIRSVR